MLLFLEYPDLFPFFFFLHLNFPKATKGFNNNTIQYYVLYFTNKNNRYIKIKHKSTMAIVFHKSILQK